MFWGTFSFDGIGTIKEVSGYMNSNIYISILKDHLKEDMKYLNCKVFQDDSAPCHRSKKVKTWEIENGIEVLDWPGNSPDINPIENLWGILKRKLKDKIITNKKDLITIVYQEWKKLSKEYMENLIYSMPKRITDIINNKGGSSKY